MPLPAGRRTGTRLAVGKADDSATFTINPDYVRQSVAAGPDRVLWCSLTHNNISLNEAMGPRRLSLYDTSGNLLQTAMMTGSIAVRKINTDAAGNFYLLATSIDSIAFANGTVVHNANINFEDNYLIRINGTTLNADWIESLGDDFNYADCMDIKGSLIYVPVDSAAGYTHIYTYNTATGARQKLFTQTGDGRTSDIAVDNNGNIYLAGSCNASLTLDCNGTVIHTYPNMSYAAYLIRYHADGQYDWHYYMQDVTCVDRQMNIANDNAIYYTGALHDSLTIGSFHYGQPGNSFQSSFMAVRLDSSGAIVWAKGNEPDTTFPSELSLASGGHTALDADGGLVLLSQVRGETNWGGGVVTHTMNNDYNAAVTRIDSNGTAQWVKLAAGDFITAQTLAVAGNNIYVTGDGMDSTGITFDGVTIPTNSPFTYYPYLARLRDGNATTGIKPIVSGANISVYPNPTRGTLTIDGLDGKGGNVLLMDAVGRLVYRSNYGGGNSRTVMNIGGVGKGVYLLHVGGAVRRVVVE